MEDGRRDRRHIANSYDLMGTRMNAYIPMVSCKRGLKTGSHKIVRVGNVSPIPSSIFHNDQIKSVLIHRGTVGDYKTQIFRLYIVGSHSVGFT